MRKENGKPAGLSRREFLGAAGAAAAGMALGSPGWTQEGKAAVLGAGYWTYTQVPNWGTPPEGMKFQMGCAVVVDSKDNVYVHSQAQRNTVVYDRDGKVLRDWGMNLGAAAHGMYLQKAGTDEFLYFSTLRPFNQIIKTDLNGKVLLTIGAVKEESTTSIKFPFNNPTDVAVAPNGDIYVCEGYGGQKVHRFNALGKFIQTIGGPGKEPGQFNTCHGIWVDTRKKNDLELYVADRANRRLQVFTMDGKLKREIRDSIRNPCCFYEWKGQMFVPDLDKVVTVLDERDQVLAQLGDGYGDTDGTSFITPHALCLDSRGDMYVVEWVADGRLRKFRHTPVKV